MFNVFFATTCVVK